MRLAAKARGLVKAVKQNKQKRVQRAKSSQGEDAVAQERYLTDFEEEQVPKEQARPTTRSVTSAAIALGVGIGVLGKRRRAMGHNAIAIHEDAQHTHIPPRKLRRMSATERMQVDSDSDEVDQEQDGSTDSEDEVDESVLDDMRRLEESFAGISQKYRLINRIGEGTFSTVYKAEQLPQPGDDDDDDDDEDADDEFIDDIAQDAPPTKRRKLATSPQSSQTRLKRKPQFVALKKIYVTSSPHRILNELELLHELRSSPYICRLITAFRHLDQVVAVLPYFRHLDFRLYYREFLTNDMRLYFRSLLSGLQWVHKAGILHRDIKPTNFLYDHTKRHGVLVDFGLAERQGTDWQHCLCLEAKEKRKERFVNSYVYATLSSKESQSSDGYPKHDTRPSRRANRAGTRGFRAPEVLFKCTAQTTKIDIWSTGVILLTILAKRFPFFNSADDVDAMIEIASIFGRKRIQATAAMHGQFFETNIETVGENGFTFEKLVIWAACREKKGQELRIGELQAVDLLEKIMELDPSKRLSAKEALAHAFFTSPVEDEVERAEREAQEAEREEAAAAAAAAAAARRH